MEKDSNELGNLFQQVIADIKSSFPLWEDFTNKAVKLHSALRCTLTASVGFLDAFQKLADSALGTRGANNDIGSSLTRLCLRHRAIESRLKNYTVTIAEALVAPLQDRIDDWKKVVVQLEKERVKEYKKCHSELKKASHETNRLKKKVNKGKVDYGSQLEESTKELNVRFAALEATEKNSLTLALMEERSHFCFLINCLKPFLDQEVGMIYEAEQLKEIIENLSKLVNKPAELSATSEEVLADATKYFNSYSTLERKKRALKEDAECDSVSNSSGSVHASLDALNLCGSATSDSSAAPNSFFALPTSLPADRSQTISYGYQHFRSRPVIMCDTFNPLIPSSAHCGKVSAMPKLENNYAVPTTLPSNVQPASKVVDKIYARPALLLNKESGLTLKPVLTPTVPCFSRIEFPSQTSEIPTSELMIKHETEGLTRLDGNSEDAQTQRCDNKEPETSGTAQRKSYFTSMSSEMQSLADALRDLEASTALLQYPYEATSAQSCQSLQCSSGYGTMTNVSDSSVETVSSNPSDLDALANFVMESCNFSELDKYSTLPSKYQMQSSQPQGFKRPASTTGLESVSNMKILPAQRDEKQDMASSSCNDSSIPSASLMCKSYKQPLMVASDTTSHFLAASIEEDDFDDLPLPPPPEEFQYASSSVPVKMVSRPLTVHSDFVQSLNEKLSLRNNLAHETMDHLSSSQATLDSGTNRTVILRRAYRAASDDSAHEADSFEHMIRRGVKLRHTICNDRSAPRFVKH